MTMTELEKLMITLDISEAEAKELMEADRAIDKGEKLFELSQEGKQIEKQMRQADRKVDAYGKVTKRERKADNDKAHLMKLIETAIGYNPKCEAFTMTNAERECEFLYNGRKFKIVLSAPRS